MAENVTVRDDTDKALRQIHGLSGRTLEDFTDKFKDNAKQRAKKRSGNNASLIESEFFGLRKKNAARVFTQSGYGGYQEFGTRNMAAQPYMRPGLQVAIKEFDDGKKWGE